MSKPLNEIPFQEFRDAAWNPNMPASYPHGMDRLLLKIRDATFKELVVWSLGYLMYSEFANKGENSGG